MKARIITVLDGLILILDYVAPDRITHALKQFWKDNPRDTFSVQARAFQERIQEKADGN